MSSNASCRPKTLPRLRRLLNRQLLRAPWRRPSVLVLTPAKNAKEHLPLYFERLNRLDWPRERLSVGLIEGDGTAGTWAELRCLEPVLRRRAARVSIAKPDFGFQLPKGARRRMHEPQFARRTVLAKVCNYLLFNALRDEDLVSWIDVDVIEFPPDILKRPIGYGRDIVHPHCVTAYGSSTFDLYSWSDHARQIMHDMQGRGEVALDSVDGTVLLIKADRHRDGLIFPPFPVWRGQRAGAAGVSGMGQERDRDGGTRHHGARHGSAMLGAARRRDLKRTGVTDRLPRRREAAGVTFEQQDVQIPVPHQLPVLPELRGVRSYFARFCGRPDPVPRLIHLQTYGLGPP